MARSGSQDPLDKFHWQIQMFNSNDATNILSRAGFYSVEVPSITMSTREYVEGGDHLHPRQIIDSVSYKPITLMRGVTVNNDFLNWAKGPFQVTGQYNDVTMTGAQASFTFDGNYRRNLLISHLDRTGTVIKSYYILNAIPIEFQPASDFAADSEDGVSMEKLVIKYESFEIQTPTGNSGSLTLPGLVGKLISSF